MPADLPRFQHRFPHRGLLPEGRHAALTWALPDDMGAMTTQTIARCNAFAVHDNRPVDLLTLTPDQDIPSAVRTLRSAGRLHRKVRVRNLWDDLRDWSDKRLANLVGTVPPGDTHTPDLLAREGNDWTELRKNGAGKILQADRYRPGNTLLVSDARDTKERGKPGGRCITLFGRGAGQVAEWHSAREFYWAWLDALFGQDKTYLLIDSPFVAGFMHDYRRENVATGVVLHDDHDSAQLAVDHLPQTNSPIEPSMLQAVTHLDAFDVAISNDERQIAEFSASTFVDERLTLLPYPDLDQPANSETVATWGSALANASFDRLRPWERPRARLESAVSDGNTVDITVSVDYASGRIPEHAYLTWKSKDRRFFGRVQGAWGICAVTASVPLAAFSGVPDGALELLVDLVQPRDFARMKVNADDGTIDNRSTRLSIGANEAGKVELTLAQGVTAAL